MISTRDLSQLPDIDTLKRAMQSMAMLDAILSPEWEYRMYSFNSKWAKGEEMGSMRNGSGDDLFALFTQHGCFLKGFEHEAKMSPYGREPKAVWPGVLDSVPPAFTGALREPAFSMEDTTFCIWRQYSDSEWQRGKIAFPKVPKRFNGSPGDPDGSGDLLSPYDGKPETYLEFATDYYSEGSQLTLELVSHVFAHQPLTTAIVQAINPSLTLTKLAADIREIDYPRKTRKAK
jgi:hypothetical protein